MFKIKLALVCITLLIIVIRFAMLRLMLSNRLPVWFAVKLAELQNRWLVKRNQITLRYVKLKAELLQRGIRRTEFIVVPIITGDEVLPIQHRKQE